MVSKVLISFGEKFIFTFVSESIVAIIAGYQSFIIIYREPRITGVEAEFESS